MASIRIRTSTAIPTATRAVTDDCAAAAPCDPMQETVALLQYMVNHNAAHANELAQLGRKLTELGNREAGEPRCLPPFPSLKKAICACPPCSLL